MSFYIVGSIGRLFGDRLLAGRYISFLSLLLISFGVGYAVKQIGGEVYDAVFAGIFCVGLFAAFSQNYVGINDPQMLGHVFVTAGLLIYLKNPAATGNIFIIASLISPGLFIKHNLVAVPIAVSIDLFLRCRRDFFKWVSYLIFIIGCLTLITCMTAGADFLSQLNSSRYYSIKEMYSDTRIFIESTLIPLIATLPWAFYAFKKERLRIFPVYLASSIIIGIYFSGGAGTSNNIFFDAYISISIAVGMLLWYLRKKLRHMSKFYKLIFPAMPIILSLSILATVPEVTVKTFREETYSKLKLQEQIYLEDAAFLATQPGPVLCTDQILLCYLAGKPYEFDVFYVGQAVIAGKINGSKVLNLIESGYFSAVQLNNDLVLPSSNRFSDNYIDSTDNILIFKEKVQENLILLLQKMFHYTPLSDKIDLGKEKVLRTLEKHYVLMRKTKNGGFYISNNT